MDRSLIDREISSMIWWNWWREILVKKVKGRKMWSNARVLKVLVVLVTKLRGLIGGNWLRLICPRLCIRRSVCNSNINRVSKDSDSAHLVSIRSLIKTIIYSNKTEQSYHPIPHPNSSRVHIFPMLPITIIPTPTMPHIFYLNTTFHCNKNHK